MLEREFVTEIEQSALELETFLVDVRRHLHRNPELSHEEHRTTDYIAALLERERIDVYRWNDCTGLCAVVHGRNEKPVVALRCDIDAVGMDDVKKVPYASRVPNVMHACGHDLHTTIALGTAITLNRLKDDLDGSVKFIFQPAEEVVPGGALEMIRRNVMEGVDAIIGFHADPSLRVGEVGLKEGPITAAADMFYVTIIGKSGHTARPHQSKDTILCTAKVIESLHQLVDREIDPREPFVLTVGKVTGGISPNVIPERAEIAGTVRVLGEGTRDRMPGLIERVVKGITMSMGISYEFEYLHGSPPVVNDGNLTRLIEGVTARHYGRERVMPTLQSMGGEDFSWYLEHAPGALVRIGVTDNGNGPSLHSNVFDVNEKVIPFGVDFFCRVIASCLDGGVA